MLRKIFWIGAITALIQIADCKATEVYHNSPVSTTITIGLDDARLWKEITRDISSEAAIAEFIPANQGVDDWKHLICLQRFEIVGNTADAMKQVMSTIENETLKKYPGSEVTFNILKCQVSDVLYEWKLHKDYEDIPTQHEVARLFLTDGYLYRIGVTKRYLYMDDSERNGWIEKLQGSVSIVAYEQAMERTATELSFANRSHERLDLSRWSSWTTNMICEQDSCLAKSLLPPNTVPKDAVEYLEICSLLDCPYDLIQPLFAAEKDATQKRTGGTASFKVLSASTTEVIYFYSHPVENLVRNVIVRSFLHDNDYYSIGYVHGLQTKATDDQIQEWKGWLEQVKVAG
ncbi:MAG: hypothetical protein Q8K75_06480 [Chlamydiales bacterium]|nr:hypothetical protein [Chlamydiales bacterium]